MLLKYDELGGPADIGDDGSSLVVPGMIAVLIGGKSKLGRDIGVWAPVRFDGTEGSKGAGRL